MFSGSKLAGLEQTRRLLKAEAELHRNVLRTEAEGWRARFERVGRVGASLASHKGMVTAVAAGVGLLAVKKGRSFFRWIPAALNGWRTIRSFIK